MQLRDGGMMRLNHNIYDMTLETQRFNYTFWYHEKLVKFSLVKCRIIFCNISLLQE